MSMNIQLRIWRKELYLDDDKIDRMVFELKMQLGENESEIEEELEKAKRERMVTLYLTGHRNRAAVNSLTRAIDSDFLTGDDCFLMLLIYARLMRFNLLPRHMDQHTELLPLLGALAKHFDTCEAFDASISDLKKIIHAYMRAKQLQRYAGAEKLLLSIFSSGGKIKDCCRFIDFLNMANDVFLSSKVMDVLEKMISTKGMIEAHQLLIQFYSLKYEMKVNGNDSKQELIEILERMIKYAKVTQSDSALHAFEQSSGERASMLKGLQMMDFILKSESTPPSSPTQAPGSRQTSPLATVKEQATLPSSPRLFSSSLGRTKETSLLNNTAVNAEPERENLSMSK